MNNLILVCALFAASILNVAETKPGDTIIHAAASGQIINTHNYYNDSDQKKANNKDYSENQEKNYRLNGAPLINISNNTMTNSHAFANAVFLAGENNYLDPQRLNYKPNKRSSSEFNQNSNRSPTRENSFSRSSENDGTRRQSKEKIASASVEKVNDF